MKSEFDRYLNMIYVKLDKAGNGYCVDNGRYLKRRTIKEATNKTTEQIDETGKLLEQQDGEVTDLLKTLSQQTERRMAQFDLYLYGANYEAN